MQTIIAEQSVFLEKRSYCMIFLWLWFWLGTRLTKVATIIETIAPFTLGVLISFNPPPRGGGGLKPVPIHQCMDVD